jgi:hypothetical protein
MEVGSGKKCQRRFIYAADVLVEASVAFVPQGRRALIGCMVAS